MLELLIGMVVGGAIAAVAYHFGHATATATWRKIAGDLDIAKSRLEAEVSHLRSKLPTI